ncbi:MAG: hypothetical protein ACOYM7_07540, partial [Paludibacter sp.]
SAGVSTGLSNQNTNFFITTNSSTVCIHNLSGLGGKLTLIDSKGVVIKNFEYTNEKFSSFNVEIPIGVIIYKSMDNSGKITTGKICPME